MNTVKERMQALFESLDNVDGDLDEINRMQIGKKYVDDICTSIQSFILQESSRLQDLPDADRPVAAFTMINALHTYSTNYMAKHTRDLYTIQGRVIEKKEIAKKIKTSLEELENQVVAEERVSTKIDSGELDKKRSIAEHPEKLSDIRRVIQNNEKDSNT